MRKAMLIGLGVGLGVLAALWALHPRPRVAAITGCATLPPAITVPGIDVSYHQDAIDWRKVERAGIRFAFIRVADGAGIRDPRFAINWRGAREAHVARGAYQYFRPDQSAAAQADLVIGAQRAAGAGELPPVLDIEVDAGLGAAELARRARAWIDRVRDQLGVEPIVYTGGDLWRAGGSPPITDQPLWLAHYASCPVIPAGWARWTFWQHTDRGAVPGIEGPVDLDVFAGSLAELASYRSRSG
ncbi:MAG TPA: GH25 family lysozyme [Kofleriaceae bacterium]